MLAKRLVEQPRAVGQIAVGEHDLDAVVTQDSQAAAGGVRGGIVGGDDHAGDAGLADGVGAGRRAALMTARLQRDVQGGSRQRAFAGGADRLDLGVRASELAMEALADHPLGVGQHGAHERVGADVAASLLGDLDRAGEVAAIGIGWGGHRCL